MHCARNFIRICLPAAVASVISFPYGTAAVEDDSPWALYTSTVQTAVEAGIQARFESCYNSAKELCESERDYCLMSLEEKIAYHTQICYEEQQDCLASCSADYEECRAAGTPSSECGAKQNECFEDCNEQGIQCVQDAATRNYELPSAEECDNAFKKCIDYWSARCLNESDFPIE